MFSVSESFLQAVNEAAQLASIPKPCLLVQPPFATPTKCISPAKLTDATRVAIINMESKQEGGKKKHKPDDIACLFGVSPTTVSKIICNKENVLEHEASNTIRHHEGLLGIDIEKALVQRIVDVNHNDGIVLGFLLETWAEDIAKCHFSDFKASKSWRKGFMRRHDLQFLMLHGEATSVPDYIVESGRIAMRQVTHGWDP